MKITDKEKTEFLLNLAKEHYSQGDYYYAWKSKKDKWHFGHSNDHELQHGQGNNTIIDDSMLEVLINRELVNNLDIPVVVGQSEQLSCSTCKWLKRTDDYCDTCFKFKKHEPAT